MRQRLAVQYLEGGEGRLPSPDEVRARLQSAFECLPLTDLLLGWDVPPPLVALCREQAARHGARLFRWHPLLCGDRTLLPRPEWQCLAPTGAPIAGFQNRPEFTFLCPNRPAVRDAVLEHLGSALRRAGYDGVFLDRIRYPSPAADPTRLLGCFCEDCCRAAEEEEFDLRAAQRRVVALFESPTRRGAVVQALLRPSAGGGDADVAALQAVLAFRARSVTRLVRAAAGVARAEGLAVGLDCFAPSLAWMVGQDLGALDALGDWIKVMVYGHTWAPAGLPFELGGLRAFANAPGVEGWAPEALAGEVRRGRAAGVTTLLAGIELVEMAGVTRLSVAQVRADLAALRAAGVDGLALSWDLQHMPEAYLSLVGEVWGEEGFA